MPEIDTATGLLTMPWWVAAVLAACALVLCVFAFLRNGVGRTLAGFAWFGVIALALGLGWNIHDRMLANDRADERRALDARLAELTLRIAAPGSPLACLGTAAGDAVEAACEKTLFSTPESIAAAVAYADARLTLLTQATDYAARGHDYDQAIAILRRPVETDRYGIFAQAFSAREHCNADGCDAAELLLQNSARVLANLKDNTFQGYVSRHAANWGQPAGPSLASAPPAAPAAPAAPTVTSSVTFPGADAIPPVSIMNNEPGMPGQNGMETPAAKPEPAKPAQQARRPAARRAAEPAQPAGSPGFPVPIAPAPRPAAANASSAPAPSAQ